MKRDETMNGYAEVGELLWFPDPLIHYLEAGTVTRDHLRQAATLRGVCEAGFEPVVFDRRVRDGGSAFVDSPEVALEILAQAAPVEMDHLARDMPMPTPQVVEGCRAFAGYISAQDGRVLRWVAVAFWWLSFAVDGRLSAGELSLAITRCHEPWLLRDWGRLLSPE